jgi:membrane fusion protein (multidrug efflux system)
MARSIPILAIALTLGCGGSAPAGGPAGPGGPATSKTKPVTVRTAELREERVERVVEITGTLRGAEEVVVSAEVEGRVERVAADLGDAVRTGATLVVLARETPRLQVAQADADYATALARAGTDDAGLDAATPDQVAAVRRAAADRDDAVLNLRRITELHEKGVAPQSELDSAKAREQITQAAHAAARDDAAANIATARARRAALGLARKRLADTGIGSPVDGIVAERLVGLGELVKPTQPVMRVVQMNPLKLRGDVPERYADAIKKGLSLDVEVDTLRISAHGTIARVGPAVDNASRTFPIEAELENADSRLKPGTFARARVVVGADELVFAVPETAISNVAGVTKVFVVDDDKAADRRVQVLRKRGSDALITGDLKAGERVIVTAIARLFPGAAITLDDGPPPSAPQGAPAKEAR